MTHCCILPSHGNDITPVFDAIIVLSGGKTGSSTLYDSFARSFRGTPVFHLHSLPSREERTKQQEQHFNEIFTRKDQRFLVVNSYRLPFSRHLSSFFQNIHVHIPDGLMNHNDTDDNVRRVTSTLDAYMNRYNFFEHYHPLVFLTRKESQTVCLYENLVRPLPRFDKVQKFGFHSFRDPVRGHEVYTILLRFDQLHRWEEQIRTVIPSFHLVSTNLSSQKTYNRLYKKVKRVYRFPRFAAMRLWELERPLINFYYDDDEIKRETVTFIAKLTK